MFCFVSVGAVIVVDVVDVAGAGFAVGTAIVCLDPYYCLRWFYRGRC